MLQPRRAANGLHQKSWPVQLLTEEVNSNLSLDFYGALNPRNKRPLFIFFPALPHRWGGSIRQRLSHKSSWTLAGVRPRCLGLWCAAVIQYMIFILNTQESLDGEGWWKQESTKMGCDVYDGKEREKGKKGQQRSVQDWKVICLQVSRSQKKKGGWTSSGGEMGWKTEELLCWCIGMVLYSRASKDFMLW